MGTLSGTWCIWWWCKTVWTNNGGSSSTKAILSRGSRSISYVGRRWQLRMRKLMTRDKWWTFCSCRCLIKMGGGGAATSHLVPAPRTLRIFIDNCFLIYWWQYITIEYDLMITNVTNTSYTVRSPLPPILWDLSQAQGCNRWCEVKTKHLCLHCGYGATCKHFVFDLYQPFAPTYYTAKLEVSSQFVAILALHKWIYLYFMEKTSVSIACPTLPSAMPM